MLPPEVEVDPIPEPLGEIEAAAGREAGNAGASETVR